MELHEGTEQMNVKNPRFDLTHECERARWSPPTSRVGLEFSTYGTVSRGVGLGGHGHKTQDTVYVELR